jgi:hypothetical protein
MNQRRLATAVAAVIATLGFVATQATRAEAPKVDRAARERFVRLLTSVRPTSMVKSVKAPVVGSLKAFGGRGAGTPTR